MYILIYIYIKQKKIFNFYLSTIFTFVNTFYFCQIVKMALGEKPPLVSTFITSMTSQKFRHTSLSCNNNNIIIIKYKHNYLLK